MQSYLSEDVEESEESKLDKFEANKKYVLEEADEHLNDEDHVHDSHSEEEEVVEIKSEIVEVLYLTGEPVICK